MCKYLIYNVFYPPNGFVTKWEVLIAARIRNKDAARESGVTVSDDFFGYDAF